jgi:hypothetical protein
MLSKISTRLYWVIFLCMLAQTAQATPMNIDDRFPDQDFFNNHIDLTFDGLQHVRTAVEKGDYQTARTALATYYRTRQIKTRYGDPKSLNLTSKERQQFAEWGQKLLNHELFEGYWTGPYTINWWHIPNAHVFARMYWWDNLAKSYIARNFDSEIAQTWVGLLHSFVDQCPPPENDQIDLFWEGLKGGIRLRSGWPLTFHVFVHADQVTDDDIILFLKSLIEQAKFIRRNHWPVGNKITFAMVGLYNTGTTFPEFKQAAEWRHYATTTALQDLKKGFLPDGMGVELSPGYHNLFYNYLTIVDIARAVGRNDEPQIKLLADGCERLFEIYPQLAMPDQQLPRYQDGGSPNVKDRLTYALKYYPDNTLFEWFATDGTSGTPPHFRSIALPYAGYIAMRTGWEQDANYVGFDVGPIGWGHAHQDKLNLIMSAYGRLLLMDPAHGDYEAGDFSKWTKDTFAHNTALVDNRPQRQKWGKSGGFMPTTPLTDYTFETQENWDRASGIYEGAYGLPGLSESYPYNKDGNFYEGWTQPATHHRHVFFLHPDIVIVYDLLSSRDGQPHHYELRWHLNSTQVTPTQKNGIITTQDANLPNMMVAPLDAHALTVEQASARTEPTILGWNFYDKKPQPATTIQHIKSGEDAVRFVTLLVPIRANNKLSLDTLEQIDEQTLQFRLSDKRSFKVTLPHNPAHNLSVVEIE